MANRGVPAERLPITSFEEFGQNASAEKHINERETATPREVVKIIENEVAQKYTQEVVVDVCADLVRANTVGDKQNRSIFGGLMGVLRGYKSKEEPATPNDDHYDSLQQQTLLTLGAYRYKKGDAIEASALLARVAQGMTEAKDASGQDVDRYKDRREELGKQFDPNGELYQALGHNKDFAQLSDADKYVLLDVVADIYDGKYQTASGKLQPLIANGAYKDNRTVQYYAALSAETKAGREKHLSVAVAVTEKQLFDAQQPLIQADQHMGSLKAAVAGNQARTRQIESRIAADQYQYDTEKAELEAELINLQQQLPQLQQDVQEFEPQFDQIKAEYQVKEKGIKKEGARYENALNYVKANNAHRDGITVLAEATAKDEVVPTADLMSVVDSVMETGPSRLDDGEVMRSQYVPAVSSILYAAEVDFNQNVRGQFENQVAKKLGEYADDPDQSFTDLQEAVQTETVQDLYDPRRMLLSVLIRSRSLELEVSDNTQTGANNAALPGAKTMAIQFLGKEVQLVLPGIVGNALAKKENDGELVVDANGKEIINNIPVDKFEVDDRRVKDAWAKYEQGYNTVYAKVVNALEGTQNIDGDNETREKILAEGQKLYEAMQDYKDATAYISYFSQQLQEIETELEPVMNTFTQSDIDGLSNFNFNELLDLTRGASLQEIEDFQSQANLAYLSNVLTRIRPGGDLHKTYLLHRLFLKNDAKDYLAENKEKMRISEAKMEEFVAQYNPIELADILLQAELLNLAQRAVQNQPSPLLAKIAYTPLMRKRIAEEVARERSYELFANEQARLKYAELIALGIFAESNKKTIQVMQGYLEKGNTPNTNLNVEIAAKIAESTGAFLQVKAMENALRRFDPDAVKILKENLLRIVNDEAKLRLSVTQEGYGRVSYEALGEIREATEDQKNFMREQLKVFTPALENIKRLKEKYGENDPRYREAVSRYNEAIVKIADQFYQKHRVNTLEKLSALSKITGDHEFMEMLINGPIQKNNEANDILYQLNKSIRKINEEQKFVETRLDNFQNSKRGIKLNDTDLQKKFGGALRSHNRALKLQEQLYARKEKLEIQRAQMIKQYRTEISQNIDELLKQEAFTILTPGSDPKVLELLKNSLQTDAVGFMLALQARRDIETAILRKINSLHYLQDVRTANAETRKEYGELGDPRVAYWRRFVVELMKAYEIPFIVEIPFTGINITAMWTRRQRQLMNLLKIPVPVSRLWYEVYLRVGEFSLIKEGLPAAGEELLNRLRSSYAIEQAYARGLKYGDAKFPIDDIISLPMRWNDILGLENNDLRERLEKPDYEVEYDDIRGLYFNEGLRSQLTTRRLNLYEDGTAGFTMLQDECLDIYDYMDRLHKAKLLEQSGQDLFLLVDKTTSASNSPQLRAGRSGKRKKPLKTPMGDKDNQITIPNYKLKNGSISEDDLTKLRNRIKDNAKGRNRKLKTMSTDQLMRIAGADWWRDFMNMIDVPSGPEADMYKFFKAQLWRALPGEFRAKSYVHDNAAKKLIHEYFNKELMPRFLRDAEYYRQKLEGTSKDFEARTAFRAVSNILMTTMMLPIGGTLGVVGSAVRAVKGYDPTKSLVPNLIKKPATWLGKIPGIWLLSPRNIFYATTIFGLLGYNSPTKMPYEYIFGIGENHNRTVLKGNPWMPDDWVTFLDKNKNTPGIEALVGPGWPQMIWNTGTGFLVNNLGWNFQIPNQKPTGPAPSLATPTPGGDTFRKPGETLATPVPSSQAKTSTATPVSTPTVVASVPIGTPKSEQAVNLNTINAKIAELRQVRAATGSGSRVRSLENEIKSEYTRQLSNNNAEVQARFNELDKKANNGNLNPDEIDEHTLMQAVGYKAK